MTGPPSAGKTAVTSEVTEHLQGFGSISGDEILRSLFSPGHKVTPREQEEAFDAILARIEELAVRNIVVDASLPESYIKRMRARLGPLSLFVLLRVDEKEWRRRERARGDRKPMDWGADILANVFAAAGADASYDLVIYTTVAPPETAARLIQVAVLERWGHT